MEWSFRRFRCIAEVKDFINKNTIKEFHIVYSGDGTETWTVEGISYDYELLYKKVEESK